MGKRIIVDASRVFAGWPEKPAEDLGREDALFEWHNYGTRRRKALINGFGGLYAELFASRYGGEVRYHHKNDGRVMIGEQKRKLKPDIVVATSKGNKYTEVKSAPFRKGYFSFPTHQLENHFGIILLEFMAGAYSPYLEFALFRHGERRDFRVIPETEVGKSYPKSDQRHLIKRMAKKTKDLVIIPSNLFLFKRNIFSSSKILGGL